MKWKRFRKAAGHLLAQEGCSQYQIMSIHGHTQAQTSEIYTKGVERWRMTAETMKRLEGMDWWQRCPTRKAK